MRLVADIGGTSARFALLGEDGAFHQLHALPTMDHDSLSQAVRAYFATLGSTPQTIEAAIGVAAPVTGDDVVMTNTHWRFSIDAVKREFGWKRLFVVNDFAANALSVPLLPEDHCIQIGDGAPAPNTAIGVVGPGTGLGVAGLVPCNGGWTPVPGEGGHATLAPMDSREGAIIDILRRQYAHVSYERVLSGPGLVNLYECLCELAGKPAAPLTPDMITNLYPGCDPQCRETVALFCGILGTFVSNIALTYGARGGIYIMGGIVPKILPVFRQSSFRERFEFKGRYRTYLAPIPTYVVTYPEPAFLGLKTLFQG